MNVNDEYLTGMVIHGVAKVLGMSKHQVWTLIHTKKLSSVRVGGTWLIDPESVRTYRKYLDAKLAVEQQKDL